MRRSALPAVVCALLAAVGAAVWLYSGSADGRADRRSDLDYLPRQKGDISGFASVMAQINAWDADASLEELGKHWHRPGHQLLAQLEKRKAEAPDDPEFEVLFLLESASLLNYEGEALRAYSMLERLRALVEEDDNLAASWLYSVIYCQGVTALRRGEDENCIMCRGESSCILPIVPAAVHTHPTGSRLAIGHFTEYLARFPDDGEVRWLLNLAHMTLGEHPASVDPRFLVPMDNYLKNGHTLGKFRDIGHLAGVNRFNQAGGAIMDDFDNDGLLDIVTTSMDPTMCMTFYRNKGDGTFEERAAAAGLDKQLGGLNCVQTDYNNDGLLDIFVPRGAWLRLPMRPSLLRNDGNGVFTDVTREAGLLTPLNSIAAAWADFDNDGWLDLFVCCDRQPNRLYRNKGDGTFEDVAGRAGVQGYGAVCKGCAWIDYDNDGWPDLFLNNMSGSGQLFHNQRDGSFRDVTSEMGINGPQQGFSCWAWDFDNDGWLDLFATSYDRSVEEAVNGLLGKPHRLTTSKLYRNLQGKGFADLTGAAGVDGVYATMGSNFADFDNDGFLDFYLGTGDPTLSTLVPNRMFKNLGGKRFADVTASSGAGHLQKGHGVACGDWDRNGYVDLFIEMGGAINGDKYHNILFQNPGRGQHSITVKLIGKKTNRAAIGARIKVVTAGDTPLTVYRHVTSGSSFGANPLEQTIGLGKAERIALVEIHWPTSGTTQVFHGIPVGGGIEVTEFMETYRRVSWKPIQAPQ